MRTPPAWIPPTPAPLQSHVPLPRPDLPLWSCFEQLGLLDRYESLISSVCYEHIEAHIVETCARKWGERMLQPLRDWMTNKIVPWMVMPYARGARTGEFSAWCRRGESTARCVIQRKRHDLCCRVSAQGLTSMYVRL